MSEEIKKTSADIVIGGQTRTIQKLKAGKFYDAQKIIAEIFRETAQISTSAKSTEGEKFNNQNEYDIYKQQHPTIEGAPVFHLDWKKYFTDYTYVNKVLNYIGSKIVLDEEKFNIMLKEINFDNSRLS